MHAHLPFVCLLLHLAPQATPPAPKPTITVSTIVPTATPVKHFALDAKQTRVALLTHDNLISLRVRGSGESLWEKGDKREQKTSIEIGGDFVFTVLTMHAQHCFRIEDGETASVVGAPDFMAETSCSAVDPLGRWVWLGSSATVVQRITPTNVNGWSRRDLKHGGSTAMALSPDGDWLAVAGADRTIRFVNSKSAQIEEKKVFEGLDAPALTLAFDAKAALLASTGDDKLIRIWTVASGKTRAKLTGHEGVVRALAFDPKATTLAAGDDKGVVRLWGLQKAELLLELPSSGGGAVTDLEFADKGKTLIGACGVNGLVVWDLSKL